MLLSHRNLAEGRSDIYASSWDEMAMQATTMGGERVNNRVPMALIRAWMKLHVLIPSDAANGINQALREKAIDMDVRNLKTEDLEQLIDALQELEIDAQSGEKHVRIYFE